MIFLDEASIPVLGYVKLYFGTHKIFPLFNMEQKYKFIFYPKKISINRHVDKTVSNLYLVVDVYLGNIKNNLRSIINSEGWKIEKISHNSKFEFYKLSRK